MQNGKTSLKVSDHLELRLPELSFSEELFTIVDKQRSHLRTWLSWIDKTQSVNHVLEFLKNLKAFNQGGQKLTTFIFKENILVGSIALVKIDKKHRFVEIGYWLREDYQGNGIITRSCKRLIDYTFKTMEINRIVIKIAKPNIKSLAIPQKLGFIHEGTLREALYINEEYFDLEIFSLLRKEWN